MNIFFSVWEALVWQPQINLLYLFYKQFNDIGYSVVALAVAANIPLLLLYAKSYINMQKTRFLAPRLQAIQKEFKEDPLEMRKKTVEFYQKHKVNNSYMMYMMLFQIFFVTGIFYIMNELQKNAPVGGMYSWLVGSDKFLFPTKAFGYLEIAGKIDAHIWILILNAIISLCYGLYTFKWAPQIKMPVSKDQTPEEALQAQSMEKMQLFVGIYMTPILISFFNFYMPVGVNIYSVIASIISLSRQFIITNYYAKDARKLYEQIVESDPAADQAEKDLEQSLIVDFETKQKNPVS
jgi:YidC/Oxa1 family membrane protein insertase